MCSLLSVQIGSISIASLFTSLQSICQNKALKISSDGELNEEIDTTII